MTRDKLEKMAKAAKIFDLYGQQAKQRTTFLLSDKELKRFQDFLEALEKFAGLVAAHEREECAKVCEAQQNMAVMRHPARIEVEQSTQNMMALKCAGLIRARGQE